jgi:hypothetical protein
MAITRSIETRLMEGLRRDFLADADIAEYFDGRIFVGPLIEDDANVVTPQINISLLPGDIYEGGQGGTTKDRFPVLVKAYFPVQGQTSSFEVGGINPHDVVSRLIQIVTAGSIDPATGVVSPNALGYVYDPDWTGSQSDPKRWLTRAWYGCTKQAAVMANDNSFLLIPFAIDYEGEIDTRTRERV